MTKGYTCTFICEDTSKKFMKMELRQLFLCKNFEIPAYETSLKYSWKVHIVLKIMYGFQLFCTKINLSFNPHFHKQSEAPSYKITVSICYKHFNG